MMSKNRTMVLAAFLLLAGLAVFMSLKSRTPFDKRKPAVSDPAPEIFVADPSGPGKMLNLSGYRGRVVLLNFWATWCPPCKDELKDFQKVYDEYEKKGLTIIAVAIDELSPSEAMKLAVSFPVVKGTDRIKADYGNVDNVPVSFLINKDGRIVKKVKGVYSGDELRRDMDKELARRGQ